MKSSGYHRALRLLTIAAVAVAADTGTAIATAPSRLRTFANPVDLPYRYQPNNFPAPYRDRYVPYREAADPTLVWFKGEYWLFASHSRGYWHSRDLLRWTFVATDDFDTQAYAPTAVVMRGRLYLAASDAAKSIWSTADPASGKWSKAAEIAGVYDPCLFLDDDGRLYLYHGLSPTLPLQVDELDPVTFKPLRHADIPASRGTAQRGWEVPGDDNDKPSIQTYVEGSWMNKVGGRYYLQYAAPGTQYRTYADGVLVADHPMGPFTYQAYSPFSSKPTGFIAGAGHGSTMQGPDGRWWRMATMTISKRHPFERRIGLFPARVAAGGELAADTYLADYPHYIDGARALTGWMLLSRGAAASASSSLAAMPPARAADEDVRTWWSAATGQPGEWFQLDLGGPKRIEAVQINFADQGSRGDGISRDGYRYRLLLSDDGRRWRTAIDRQAAGRDAPHDYEVLPTPRTARYVRLVNAHMPDGGAFSLYDLRVFGRGGGPLAAPVTTVLARRDPADARKAMVSWPSAAAAQFYVVRVGVSPDLLIQTYQVYDGRTALLVPSLNAGSTYWVAVDAVNQRGITPGRPVAIASP